MLRISTGKANKIGVYRHPKVVDSTCSTRPEISVGNASVAIYTATRKKDCRRRCDTAKASPPSLDDVQAFLTAADSVPPSERALNTGFRLATGGGDSYVSTGIKRVDGGWVHRNYLAR